MENEKYPIFDADLDVKLLACPSCNTRLENIDLSTESPIVRSVEFIANLVCPSCGAQLKHTGFILFLEHDCEGVGENG